MSTSTNKTKVQRKHLLVVSLQLSEPCEVFGDNVFFSPRFMKTKFYCARPQLFGNGTNKLNLLKIRIMNLKLKNGIYIYDEMLPTQKNMDLLSDSKLKNNNSGETQKDFNSNSTNSINSMGSMNESFIETQRPLTVKTRSELPTFSKSTFCNLPPILAELTEPFENPNHKDIALLSSLTFLSSLFPMVYAQYSNDYHHANLFTVIVAPSSTGKSNVRIGEYLVQPLVTKMHEHFKEQMLKYQNLPNSAQISPPREKTLIISANTSDSALIESLAINKGLGIIYTNEMDTQACQEWSNLSPYFRLIFDHQRVNKTRINGNVTIENPRCSILYTGTPNQFTNIINDIQTGLHQRFLMYTFGEKVTWINPFNKTYNMKELGTAIYEKHLNGLMASYGSKKIIFSLQENQQNLFNNYLQDLLETIQELEADDLQSIVTRGGNILQRLAMVLTICRNVEPSNKIFCTDLDFLSALNIFDVCFKHSLFMAQVRKIDSCPANLKPLYRILEQSNTKLSFGDLKAKLGEETPQSTLNAQLNRLIKLGFVNKTSHGVYEATR
jgi:hypothetical protein